MFKLKRELASRYRPWKPVSRPPLDIARRRLLPDDLKRQETFIKWRWLYTFNTLLLIFDAFDKLHSWNWVMWLLVFSSVVNLVVTLSAWRLWWRRKYPAGARLAFRFWEKTSKGEPLPTPEEDEHVWPPAPKRP